MNDESLMENIGIKVNIPYIIDVWCYIYLHDSFRVYSVNIGINIFPRALFFVGRLLANCHGIRRTNWWSSGPVFLKSLGWRVAGETTITPLPLRKKKKTWQWKIIYLLKNILNKRYIDSSGCCFPLSCFVFGCVSQTKLVHNEPFASKKRERKGCD